MTTPSVTITLGGKLYCVEGKESLVFDECQRYKDAERRATIVMRKALQEEGPGDE
jgi:hypothetical protein